MNKPKQVDQNTALWLERMSGGGECSSDQARAFDAWILGEDRRAEDYGEMRALWESDVLVAALAETAWHRPVRPSFGQRLKDGLRTIGDVISARPWVAAAGAMAVLFLSAGVMVMQSITVESYESAPGEMKPVVLADGSRLTVHGNSLLNVRMTPWSRTVRLERGEVYFDVAHERWRNFSVKGGQADVTVLGTAFDVDRRADGAVLVQVYRGKVGVESDRGDRWVLPAGIGIGVMNGRMTRLDVQPGGGPDWMNGWFETADAPLSTLVEQINRFSARPVDFEDPALADLTISGRFYVKEPEKVLHALSETHDMKWRQINGRYILSR